MEHYGVPASHVGTLAAAQRRDQAAPRASGRPVVEVELESLGVRLQPDAPVQGVRLDAVLGGEELELVATRGPCDLERAHHQRAADAAAAHRACDDDVLDDRPRVAAMR